MTLQDIWKDSPEDHDYPAAHEFLTLLFEEAPARKLVTALRKATTIRRKAKDLLRASALPLLPRENPHVSSDLHKIKKGKPLSPVLLVRGNSDSPLIIADGYHRICASWYRDENVAIACRIVSYPR